VWTRRVGRDTEGVRFPSGPVRNGRVRTMFLEILLPLLFGFVALVAGADLLVRSASAVARRFGISPLVVGLTVVAYGTSAPELVVSTVAATQGNSSIAIANVVGSNIFNVLFILGLCAMVRPLVIHPQLVQRDIPIMVAASVLLWVSALDGFIGLLDGALLFAGAVAFTVWTIRESRREHDPLHAADRAEAGSAGLLERSAASAAMVLVAGLLLLVQGARATVAASVALATAAGISESVVGLTVVAVGTSLPEVFTSLVATWRGERDIAVGNVVGSCVFNILGIVGVASLLGGGDLSVDTGLRHLDLPVMTAAAFACLPIVAAGHRILRWQGGLFFFHYAVYTTWLVLASQKHDALPLFSDAMLRFVLPLTTVTLVTVFLRSLAARPAAES
jgi:cation:H+ antiporter